MSSVRGFGYTNGATSQDKNGATVVTTYTITTSGVIGGTTICTYAGRVWIGSSQNCSISRTCCPTYNSFGGAGGSFTITDSYLNNNINAMCAANNYMYIFGDDSIDALSNVTVSRRGHLVLAHQRDDLPWEPAFRRRCSRITVGSPSTMLRGFAT